MGRKRTASGAYGSEARALKPEKRMAWQYSYRIDWGERVVEPR